MESSRLALTVLVLLVSLTLPLGLRDVSSSYAEYQHRRLEVARLRAHFDSVDAELRLPTALPLTPAQHTGRATLIGWLREYREGGGFPRNDRFPDRAVPFFRDSRGVLCAMAYLIDRSGRGDLVDRVASTRNNAFIPELAGDPELRAWLNSVGLSVAEAARIQPWYGPPPGGTGGAGSQFELRADLHPGQRLFSHDARVQRNRSQQGNRMGWRHSRKRRTHCRRGEARRSRRDG